LNSGADLTRWDHDPKLLSQRRRVLERLRARLVSPQPREKRIRRQYKDTCDWDVGEIIAYRLLSGHVVLFRVVGYVTDPVGTSPVCELLDWIGAEPPSEDTLKRLNVRPKEWPPDRLTDQFTISRTKADELPIDRVTRLGVRTKPSTPRAIQGMFSWKNLDQSLARCYESLLRGAV
jgi:hypothetical protein